ncbi:hypothetical protein ACE6H2_005140 [Prunus campanulata]
MGPQESETGSDKFRLLVKLSSNTPVFGCRMFPIVRVTRHQSFLQLEVPPHELTFSWYREQTSSSFDREKVRCSVHLDMLAKMQCEECVKLNLSVKGSYHCSNSCYVDAWEKHKVYHRYAAETVSETLSNNQQEVRNVKSYGPDKYWPESDFVVGSSSDKNEKVMEPDGKIWIKVGSSKSYAPTEHDIGHHLRLECAAVDCSMGTNITPVNITVTDPVIYPPAHPPRSTIKCVWKSWNSGLEAHSSSDLTFSVLSYNILAGIYAFGNRYSYCPEWALSWEYRMQNIINEIIEYDADILCLQERDHFEDLLKPALAKCGYSVLYKTKTKEVYTPNQYTIDGCATFYRHNKFKEIVKYELEYDKSALPFVEALEPELKKAGRFRLLKDNVALVVILERVKNEECFDGNQPRICVANTHIHASEKFPDVKLVQVVSLINGLEKIANSKIPLLICGDLNSLPLSIPHSFISKGILQSVPNKENDPLGVYQYLWPCPIYTLKSAYACFFQSDGIEEQQRRKMDSETMEPIFTNFTSEFTGTLDYIFFTVNSLRLESVLELLDKEALGSGLPSPQWSSDHIALMGSFTFTLERSSYQGQRLLPCLPSPWRTAAAR